MTGIYGRDLDLNLLRVFAAVTEAGGVTAAASRLYLTQSAVSAALRRLTEAVGAPLFARRGRSLVLTGRGERLRDGLHPHLERLIAAALAPPTFDPRTSARVLRIGLADAAEQWLLPPLLRELERDAPHLQVVATTVQFRTVGAALAGGLDMAVTVADELPASIRRTPLLASRYWCLYDPRLGKLRGFDEAGYFAREHIVVSYNGDLRGVVEDLYGRTRRVRCSVSSFAHVGALIEGTRMVATLPELVARQITAVRPKLALVEPPFLLGGASADLLWPVATDDDEPCRFVRQKIEAIARATSETFASIRRTASRRSARAPRGR